MSFGKNNTSKSGTSTGQDTTSGTTDYNTTTTPTNPDWVSNLASSLGGNVSSLAAGGNPRQYIAGANSNLANASTLANQLGPQSSDYANATGVTNGVASASSPDIASNISKFMSPYLSGAVAATNASLDHSDALARAQNTLTQAGSGAFGGSGAALGSQALEQGLALARGQTIGNLENTGYGQALGGAESQGQLDSATQGQRLAAGGQLANIASQYGANDRANVATLDAAGQPIQQIAQANAQAPLDFQKMLTGLFSGLPLSLFQGQTANGNQVQNGTESQVGANTGNSTGYTFGFGGGK